MPPQVYFVFPDWSWDHHARIDFAMLPGCHLKGTPQIYHTVVFFFHSRRLATVAVVLWTLCAAVINTPTKVHALQSAKSMSRQFFLWMPLVFTIELHIPPDFAFAFLFFLTIKVSATIFPFPKLCMVDSRNSVCKIVLKFSRNTWNFLGFFSCPRRCHSRTPCVPIMKNFPEHGVEKPDFCSRK